MSATQLPDTVRAEMARNRVSQSIVAKELHLSQAAISRRLKGEVDFTHKELASLSNLLKVPVGTFFGEVRS